MDLHSGRVPSEVLQRQLTLVDDQQRLLAVRGEGYLEVLLARLVGVPGDDDEPMWRLARLDAAGALPAAGVDLRGVRSANSQVAVDLAEPVGQTRRIGQG